MSEYGPRSEALRIFAKVGLSESTLTRKTKPNRENEIEIETLMPDDKERGMLYRLDQVRLVAQNHWEKKHRRKKKESPSTIAFRRMEIEEMSEVAEILSELFSGRPNIPQWQDRLRANPDTGFVVTNDNIIVGCGFVVPHTEEKILSILPREETPPTYPHEIPAYAKGLYTCLYLRSVGVTKKDISFRKRARCAQILIIGMLKEIVKLGSKGIFIEKIYARSDTFQGERMLHRLGFTRLTTTTTHKNFVIDVEPSGITFVKQYKAALIAWRKKNEGA